MLNRRIPYSGILGDK